MSIHNINNRLIRLFLHLTDAFLSVLFLGRKKKQKEARSFRNILLCNMSHLGDVVISTAILPQIKKQFPDCRIGMLVGSWSLPIVKGHPLIDQIHLLDHWKLNRSDKSIFGKIIQYFKTRKKAIQEIRSQKYDVAVDLYYFFPNAIFYLWRANIPARIGYTSGGLRSLLTHPVEWKDGERSVLDYHFDLLKILNIVPEKREAARPILPGNSSLAAEKSYCVFHMGAGLPIKEWSVEKWKELLTYFVDKRDAVLFTGQGEKQKEMIQSVIAGIDGAVDLSNALKWEEFVGVIQHAKLLISVDSVAGHIASAFDVPTIVLFSGIHRLSHWKPVSPQCRVLIKPVPCAPCLKKEGCQSMECIQGITVADVIQEVGKLE